MDGLKDTQKDFLTGFYTREHLTSELDRRITDANIHNEKFSILLIDIDHFKKINDKHGHLWGDEFLKFIGSTLRLTLEDKGLIFRYGGDEFVVLFSTTDPKQAFLLAKQFNLVVRNRPFLFNGHLFKITISCGLATFPKNGTTPEALMENADKALYFSKRFGRNTTTQAGKIGFYKIRIALVVLLEICFIAGLAFFAHSYFFKDSFQRFLAKLPVKRIISTGVAADTTVVLKSGQVISGKIVDEDQKKLVMEVSLGRGSCTMNIEKGLIQSITHHEPENKE